MPCNINKCQILQGGAKNVKNDYEMPDANMKSVYSVKDLGGTVASNLKFSQQCNESVFKTNRMMIFIKRFFFFTQE